MGLTFSIAIISGIKEITTILVIISEIKGIDCYSCDHILD